MHNHGSTVSKILVLGIWYKNLKVRAACLPVALYFYNIGSRAKLQEQWLNKSQDFPKAEFEQEMLSLKDDEGFRRLGNYTFSDSAGAQGSRLC